jgi:NhaP-type Na+/H+ or K+/H+ antiporter
MGIYDVGTEFPWEIWVGLLIAAVVLYLAVRTSRRADRRHLHAAGATTQRTGTTTRHTATKRK